MRNIFFGALCILSMVAVAATVHVDVAKDKAGSEPASFLGVVGNWVVAQDGGKNVLLVDGRQWKKGQPAGGLASKARLHHPPRHDEVIENGKAFPRLPHAIAPRNQDI